MKIDHLAQALGFAAALLLYAALDDKIRAGMRRLTARRDVYDKGFADGYERGIDEVRRRPGLVPVPRNT